MDFTLSPQRSIVSVPINIRVTYFAYLHYEDGGALAPPCCFLTEDCRMMLVYYPWAK